MTESFEHIVSPGMAELIAEDNWTAAELLEEEEITDRATVPAPRHEMPTLVVPVESPEEHCCPLDIVDARARENAIRAQRIDIANEIDADTLQRHAGCVRGEGPGMLACAKMLDILDADSDQDDQGRDDIYELFG